MTTVPTAPKHSANGRGPNLPAQVEHARFDSRDHVPLPPIGVLLARPVLLVVCAIVGALGGFAVSGQGGYQATAALEFTVDGNDIALVEMAGQTLARRTTTTPVVHRAATALGEPADDIADAVTAKWQQQSQVVDVVATAPTAEAAVQRANAVAAGVVELLEDEIEERLIAARHESNSLLDRQAVTSPDAEGARREQVGISLAERQYALNAESGSVFVAEEANRATPAGITRSIGASIGLVAGLCLGGFTAVLLGTRGLRASTPSALRRLAPGVEVRRPNQVPRLVGRLVDGGASYVAVVVTPGSADAATEITAAMAKLFTAHGKTVATHQPDVDNDPSSAALLRKETRRDVRGRIGADVVIVTVDAGGSAAAMLAGQSDLAAVVVLRRGKTPVGLALAAAQDFQPAEPALIVAN